MAEKRPIIMTVSIIMDGQQQLRFDLRAGEDWEDGAPCTYRLYRDRSKVVTAGASRFLTLEAAFQRMAAITAGTDDISRPVPEIPYGARIRLLNEEDGISGHERAVILGGPYRLADGRDYVLARPYGKRHGLYPLDTAEIVGSNTI